MLYEVITMSFTCPPLTEHETGRYRFVQGPNKTEQKGTPKNHIDFTIVKKLVSFSLGEFEIKTESNLTSIVLSILLKDDHKLGVKVSAYDTKTQELIPPVESRNIEDANILLVEDNSINQKIVILSLKNKVKNIEVANNGKEALDKFGSAKYA